MRVEATPKICYLCGASGADTKDHVPPKCLLPRSGTQRLTIPAHKSCNARYALDEEYFRDLIAPTALDYPDGDDIYFSTQRAWQKPQGMRRLRMFLKNSVPLRLRSEAGLYLGKATGVHPDAERIRRVGLKIAQGVIFSDTGSYADTRDFAFAQIASSAVPKERDDELRKGNPYWQVISFEGCRHTNFSASVAVRRAYVPVRTYPALVCVCQMLLMVYSRSFVISGEVSIAGTPHEIEMVGLLDEFESVTKLEEVKA